MKLFRQLSTRSLILLVSAVVLLAASAGAIAVAASGGSKAVPPQKSLADALHDALTAPEPQGITAHIKFTNNLFPSGALGSGMTALMSGASGRLWVTNDGRGRIELQSDAGDAQIVWNTTEVTVYDAASNTVYRAKLPAPTTPDTGATKQPPTVAEITDFLAKLGQHASVSDAQPSNVAGQPAYTVSVSPKHDGGLLGSVELAWDAVQGVPLRAAIYAQGSSTPVLEVTATDISYGPVAAADVDVSPPAGAKVVDLGTPQGKDRAAGAKPDVSGLDAVQKQLSFTLAAPDTLVGLPRQTVQLVGSPDSKGALIVYGRGLGAVVVYEHAADATANGKSPLNGLPPVSIGGATGHELATQLGTVIQFERGGVSFVLAGSMPPAAAEAAARALK